MLRVRAVLASAVVVAVMGATAWALPQQKPPAPQPGAAQPPATPGAPAQPGPPVPVQPRTFTAPAGLLFNTVRPERVADFEKVLAYLRAALEKSTDEKVREQAKGWHFYKATETLNGAVLYVYFLEPTVPGAEYGIGKILADAYPDQVNEIWKLYNGAVSSGGSLMNLTPVKPMAPPPLEPASKPKADEKP
jgi:hypothetical protein